MEIQRAMADRNAEDRRIEFRIGINVGDIIVDACATVNGGEGAFSEVAGQAHV
jgi:class 3 adenylate cyclase